MQRRREPFSPAPVAPFVRSEVDYRRTHASVVRSRGRAADHPCTACGGPALDWALQTLERAEPSENGKGWWSPHVEDYAAMCRSCHQKMDRLRDPEWNQKSGEAGARTLGKWYRDNPVEGLKSRSSAGKRGASKLWSSGSALDREKHSAAARVNAVTARERLEELQADPVEGAKIKKRQSEGGRRGGGSQKRWCGTCGRETTATGLAAHQRWSGHEGVLK